MSSFLYRLGHRAVAARRVVVGAWLAVLLVVGGAFVGFGGTLDNDVSIPGTEAQDALDRLAATFPQVSGASAQIIVVAPEGARVTDPQVREAVEATSESLSQIESVAGVVTPYDELVSGTTSADGRAGLVAIQLEGSSGGVSDATKEALAEITEALDVALPEGGVARLGGQLFSAEFPEMSWVEATGLVVALVVLVLALGSLVAAGMPLLNALLGVGISVGLVFLAAAVIPTATATPMLALMLGLAVGIDYALFIVSRARELLGEGLSVPEAAARATGTAGSAVVFAGLTVMIALVGLGVAGIPFLATMGVAASVAVAISVVISVTLTPALLGAAGERLRPKHALTTKAEDDDGRLEAPAARPEELAARPAAPATGKNGGRFFEGWVRTVTRVPALTIALVIGALALLALPAADLRLALPDAGALPPSSSARQTYDLVSEHFGPGANGPLIVTGSIVTSTDPLGLMADLAEEIRAMPGVDSVPLSTPNESADTGIIQVVPTTAPESQETTDLVHAIRAKHDHFLETYGVDLAVTGFTAVGIDVSAKLGGALLPFGLVVVGLSLVLLTMVFRSIWVPVKATLGYLLSVGSAFGVVTLVFERGWLAGLLQVDHVGPVISFMPIVVMGVLFGLAMDYEVFLVSRIREDFVHGGDARAAVRSGFRGAAGVVTAAAVIMCAVFIAFVPHGDSNIKPIALGLAVGVAVDAFVVRMVLVPAVLEWLGDRAWWMPRWLDRVLPSFDVEGSGVRRELELAQWPEPGADDAIAAADLRAPGSALPVSVRLPHGGVLLVHGAETADVSALLLTLTGRLEPAAGICKVDGLTLPERSSSVRRRAAYVNLDLAPITAVAEAIAERPRVLVVDRTELVGDPAQRATLGAMLSRAHSEAGTTLVLGAVGPATLDQLTRL
ncbi:MAG: MMPL family transporter, partial [Actinomycetota bacterium]|nr:MMPL family transporter [Actinomycetota bacterium]